MKSAGFGLIQSKKNESDTDHSSKGNRIHAEHVQVAEYDRDSDVLKDTELSPG